MSPSYAVLAESLRKRYRTTWALNGLDVAVPPGVVYGLLGPNGAGKTTAVRILSTLLDADSGRAEVAGYDVARQPRDVRRRIGMTGQHITVDDKISAYQNLVMFGRLFHIGRAAARRRATELLAQFHLSEAARKPPKTFSGGMRRRLDLASSMILAPEVLFLDEPTTGLDPAGRREVWEAVTDLAGRGTTVLLTTHYLDEADKLCDRIGVVSEGEKLVEDTPTGLKRQIGNERLEVVAADTADLSPIAELAARAADSGTTPTVDDAALTVRVAVPDGVAALTEVAAHLREHDIAVADIGLRRPTLDEAFLHLTGGTDTTDTTAAPAATPEPRSTTAAKETVS